MDRIPVWIVLFKQKNISAEYQSYVIFYRVADLKAHILTRMPTDTNPDFEELSLAQCILECAGSPADYQDYQVKTSDLLKMHVVVDKIVQHD